MKARRQPASATDRSDRGLTTGLEGAVLCTKEFVAIESLGPLEPQILMALVMHGDAAIFDAGLF
jgi:hypothetical protein